MACPAPRLALLLLCAVCIAILDPVASWSPGSVSALASEKDDALAHLSSPTPSERLAFEAAWRLRETTGGQAALGFLFWREGSPSGHAAQAAFWLRKAADSGDPLAQRTIGAMLLLGRGVQAEPSTGIGYLRKAADKGVAAAQQDLGIALLEGIGSRTRGATGPE